MPRYSILLNMFAVLFPFASGAQVAPTVSLHQNGWTIECSSADGSLIISSDRVGVVARDVHLNEETPAGLRRLVPLKARIEANKLMVETTDPATAWRFEADTEKLEIETTDFHGYLTGSVPASEARMIARLMDPEGKPVVWQGSAEAVETYGGTRTASPSHLPRQNPEVLYLRMGKVSGANFHSLFDRDKDVAIDFGDAAALRLIDGSSSSDKGKYELSLPVHDKARIEIKPDYYTRSLGLPFYKHYDDTRFPSAPMVWSSWTSYYEAVTEQDIVRNTDWLAAKLKPYGFEYVQLDDGYDRQPDGHSWADGWNPERFPHGPEWLTSYIHSKGLKAGLWLVPNSYSPALKQHPEWYLYDKQGKVLMDYLAPALDPTNPHVFNHLSSLFTKLDKEGFDYYKFDGEQAFPVYAPSVDRSRLYSPSIDFIENYRKRLALIRETIGPDRFIELCPTGTPLNAVGYADSYFNGDDLYNNWQGMYSLFSGVLSNLFLNHVVSYVMPGEGLELGEPMSIAEAAAKRPKVTLDTEREREDPATGFGTTMAEARTLTTYIALTGVAYPLASVMPELSEERVKLLQATMPTLPIMPIDLFSRGTESSWDKFKHVTADTYIHHYPELLDLKVNSAAGVYDVAAETNWRSQTTGRTLDFGGQLGLSGGQYVVFDFWKQSPLGVFAGKIDVTIAPHDTRVLAIHPLLGRPQLIGNSRHISGTYSIATQAWESDRKELHGESLTLPGKDYALWFHLPDGFTRSSVEVKTKEGSPIDTKWSERDGFAKLSFTGTSGAALWQIRF